MSRRAASVFLNVPFDPTYERYFIGLIAAVVSVGRAPRCVLELPEHGSGRLKRLIKHIGSCSLSVHDLSRVGTPARFNMPFELGLAAAPGMSRAKHSYVLLERKQYRLDKTLSDIKGRDPLIYKLSVKRLIALVVGTLQRANSVSVDPEAVYDMYRSLSALAPRIRRRHSANSIYTRAVFLELVTAATVLAEERGFLRSSRRRRGT